MIDRLIRNATIVDGTGAPARVGDVGIDAGRICAVGQVDDGAREVIDGTDLVVCPGFIDPHTHFDAQLLWDGCAKPALSHGVRVAVRPRARPS